MPQHSAYAISQKKRKWIEELRLDEDHRHAEDGQVTRSLNSRFEVRSAKQITTVPGERQWL